MRTLNGTLHRDFISERNCTIPAETTRESLLIEDEDIVRTSQQCEESGRNVLTLDDLSSVVVERVYEQYFKETSR